jgi:hypothetical protein
MTGLPKALARFRSRDTSSGELPSVGSSCQMIITAGALISLARSKVLSSHARSAERVGPPPAGPGTLRVAKTTPPHSQRAFSGTSA